MRAPAVASSPAMAEASPRSRHAAGERHVRTAPVLPESSQLRMQPERCAPPPSHRALRRDGRPRRRLPPSEGSGGRHATHRHRHRDGRPSPCGLPEPARLRRRSGVPSLSHRPSDPRPLRVADRLLRLRRQPDPRRGVAPAVSERIAGAFESRAPGFGESWSPTQVHSPPKKRSILRRSGAMRGEGFLKIAVGGADASFVPRLPGVRLPRLPPRCLDSPHPPFELLGGRMAALYRK